tara:strand:- start:11618 stop:12046 length:429 start_codon:yes stop_codon:yes gene_type:complete
MISLKHDNASEDHCKVVERALNDHFTDSSKRYITSIEPVSAEDAYAARVKELDYLREDLEEIHRRIGELMSKPLITERETTETILPTDRRWNVAMTSAQLFSQGIVVVEPFLTSPWLSQVPKTRWPDEIGGVINKTAWTDAP